ncbi:hypothetical protein HYW76_05020 [Candidatus Pacearchaeota archaeon]|nr:hypothetical protein [Candidatus Pacearchaeota archaeon]
MDKLEIYDCTLREGAQAARASFSIENRVELFKLLDKFGADYIEVGWPIDEEILNSFELCRNVRSRAKIVAFGSTSIGENPEEDKNLLSLVKSRAEYACIFGKSWKEHVINQLKITPEENLKKIAKSIEFLKNNNMGVFYDAEHYFDWFKDDKEYAIKTLISAAKAGAERLILCDTNGGTLPQDVGRIIKETKEELAKNGIFSELGIHCHNDLSLALANTLASIPYITQVQGTINGIGERVGNLDIITFLAVYIKKLGNKLDFDLKTLKEVYEKSCNLCNIEKNENHPVVGELANTHRGGVHIDAILKGARYEHENPEDFGAKRIILLNSLGGGAGVMSVAKQFGIELDKKDEKVKEKIKEVLAELKDMEKRGYGIGGIEAEQYLILMKHFGNLKEIFKIERWEVKTDYNNGKEESEFLVITRVNMEIIEDKLKISGGPVDAAYKILMKILKEKYPEMGNLQLIDFHVSIARRMKEESTVRTAITFANEEEFETVGVDRNIIQSAIEALEKGFRYYLNKTIVK